MWTLKNFKKTYKIILNLQMSIYHKHQVLSFLDPLHTHLSPETSFIQKYVEIGGSLKLSLRKLYSL